MERIVHGRTIRLLRGDITQAASDGIVNNEVTFYLFSDSDLQIYERTLAKVTQA